MSETKNEIKLNREFIAQVTSIRTKISKVFKKPPQMPNKLLPQFSTNKQSDIPKRTPKPKEFSNLPSISIHRNPFSCVLAKQRISEKFVGKRKLLQKFLSYRVISDKPGSDLIWEKLLKRHSEII